MQYKPLTLALSLFRFAVGVRTLLLLIVVVCHFHFFSRLYVYSLTQNYRVKGSFIYICVVIIDHVCSQVKEALRLSDWIEQHQSSKHIPWCRHCFVSDQTMYFSQRHPLLSTWLQFYGTIFTLEGQGAIVVIGTRRALTPNAEASPSSDYPLSRLTIAGMEDLEYTVD